MTNLYEEGRVIYAHYTDRFDDIGRCDLLLD